MAGPLLNVKALTLGVRSHHALTPIVKNISFAVPQRGRFGLVGESGSGKSLTLRALAGLLPSGLEVMSGSVEFEGIDLLSASSVARRQLMGSSIAMVFQEPMTALNPVMRVGEQIAETVRLHLHKSRSQAHQYTIQMMHKVGIPDPERRYQMYPHELSGGLRQRVMIAMALSCSPKLLLCDEPTTALDVIVQAQIIDLIRQLCNDIGAAVVFVSHDLAVVSELCRYVAVMQHGVIVESGPTAQVFGHPDSAYTQKLLSALPVFERENPEMEKDDAKVVKRSGGKADV